MWLLMRVAARTARGEGRQSPGESAALADSLSTAFMIMPETLSPVERAVFLLHEVFDYDHAEVRRRLSARAK